MAAGCYLRPGQHLWKGRFQFCKIVYKYFDWVMSNEVGGILRGNARLLRVAYAAEYCTTWLVTHGRLVYDR